MTVHIHHPRPFDYNLFQLLDFFCLISQNGNTLENKRLTLTGRWNDAFSKQDGAVTVIKAPKAPWGSLTLQNVNIVP